MVKVDISFVDGSGCDFEEDDAFYNRFLELQRSGAQGKKLIVNLLSDDWGAPPRGITISGTLEDGSAIERVYIPYR